MIFTVKQKGYQAIAQSLKVLANIIPIPKPMMFNGAGASLELCQLIVQMGIKHLLIVTDRNLANLGMIQPFIDCFEEHEVSCTIFDKVLPDPCFDQVEEGLSFLLEQQCEAVLSIGGGSVIDVAKVIAASVTNRKPLEKLTGMLKIRKLPIPHFSVPTTAGTGSEASIAAVISEKESAKKRPIIDPNLVPVAAALDGTLMVGLPPHITAATGMDALTHAIEAYISVNATKDTDLYALAAVKIIVEHLPIAFSEGHNVESRQQMAQASFYAAIAFSKASLGYVHAISHSLSALYHTPHGYTNAVVLPYVLEYSIDHSADRLAQLARAANLIEEASLSTLSTLEQAKQFIEHIRSLLSQLALPHRFAELNPSHIPKIAKMALKEAHYNYPVPKYLNQRECEGLIRKMLVTA